MSTQLEQDDMFANLRSLVESNFPRTCRNCGREFVDAKSFIEGTVAIKTGRSGFKLSEDDDGSQIIELFRNCACGSTMLENFCDRRDLTEVGLKRRARFGALLNKLIAAGVTHEVARGELLKLVRGQENNLVELIRSTKIEDS